MKKCFLYLSVLLLFITACKKTTNEVSPAKVVYVTVDKQNWGTTDTRTWVAGIDVSALDDKYIQSGATLVYRKTSDRDYEQWPVVYKGISYSYSVRKGQIVLDVTPASGQATITRPEPMTFKLVLMDAQ